MDGLAVQSVLLQLQTVPTAASGANATVGHLPNAVVRARHWTSEEQTFADDCSWHRCDDHPWDANQSTVDARPAQLVSAETRHALLSILKAGTHSTNCSLDLAIGRPGVIVRPSAWPQACDKMHAHHNQRS